MATASPESIEFRREDELLVFTVRGEIDADTYRRALEGADAQHPPSEVPLRLWDVRRKFSISEIERLEAVGREHARVRGDVRVRAAVVASDGDSVRLARRLLAVFPTSEAEVFYAEANARAWLRGHEEEYWRAAGYQLSLERSEPHLVIRVDGRLDIEAIGNVFVRVNQPADDHFTRRLWDLRNVSDVDASGFQLDVAAKTQKQITIDRHVAFVLSDSRFAPIIRILGLRQPTAEFRVFYDVGEATAWLNSVA